LASRIPLSAEFPSLPRMATVTSFVQCCATLAVDNSGASVGDDQFLSYLESTQPCDPSKDQRLLCHISAKYVSSLRWKCALFLVAKKA